MSQDPKAHPIVGGAVLPPSPSGHGPVLLVGGRLGKAPRPALAQKLSALVGGGPLAIVAVGSRLKDERLMAIATPFAGPERPGLIRIDEAPQAREAARLAPLAEARAILLLGPSPERVVALLDGSPLEQVLHGAMERRGTALIAMGGAAAALSRVLVVESEAAIHPTAGLVHPASGLGFLGEVALDHHFAEQHAMGRLLAMVHAAPTLLGLGLDAHTALVLVPGRRLEVWGEGAVTLLEAPDGAAGPAAGPEGSLLAINGVALHVFPSGFAFDLQAGLPPMRGVPQPRVPPELRELATRLVSAPAAP